MNVLVTGCFGFIGGNLFRFLNSNNHKVYGIGRNSSFLNSSNCLVGDVNFNTLNEYKLRYGVPDLIYHLTGGSTVGSAISKPFEEYENTVTSAVDLLDWVRLNSPNSKVIIASSAAVYGLNGAHLLKESDAANPFSNYGYYKYVVETLSEMYVRNYKLNVTCARIFSVYGEGLRKQLLWDVCQKLKTLKKGDSITCFGTGNEVRDWIHIEDVCNALYEIGRCERPLNIINIGTGIPHTVSHLVKNIIKCWFSDEDDLTLIFNQQVREGDPFSLVSDNSLKKIVSGQDNILLEEGIRRYITWLKDY